MMMATILQIMLYLLICIIVYVMYNKNSEKKISLRSLVFICILFTLYNVLCTSLSLDTAISDRLNYTYEFMGYRKTSVGLTFVFNIIKTFSNDVRMVFYFTTFVCSFITFYALFNDKKMNKYGLLFFLCTDYIFFTFSALKQCYTCAIASLIFYIFFNCKKKYKNIIIAFLIFVACLFHSTGFLLIPVLLLACLHERKHINLLKLIIFLILFLVLLDRCLLIIATLLNGFIPIVSNKIFEYFYSEGLYTDSKLVFIKGIPFYLISFIGIIKAKKYNIEIEHYDKLIFFSLIGALGYLLSFTSYWMYRITTIFYFPISVLFGILMQNENNKKNKILYFISILLSEFAILLRWLILEFIQGGF